MCAVREGAAQAALCLQGIVEHIGNTGELVVIRNGDENFLAVFFYHFENDIFICIIFCGDQSNIRIAIQQLTNYAVNSGSEKRIRVHVDAENYRAKREQSLVALANKVAAKVTKYRRSVTLEPMNAYERHVIHAALQDVPKVSTYSTGVEPNRRTVVVYSPDKQV